MSDKDIADEDNYQLPQYDPEALDRRLKRVKFAQDLDAFLKKEGALAWVRKSYRDGKARERRRLYLHGRPYAVATWIRAWRPKITAV